MKSFSRSFLFIFYFFLMSSFILAKATDDNIFVSNTTDSDPKLYKISKITSTVTDSISTINKTIDIQVDEDNVWAANDEVNLIRIDKTSMQIELNLDFSKLTPSTPYIIGFAIDRTHLWVAVNEIPPNEFNLPPGKLLKINKSSGNIEDEIIISNFPYKINVDDCNIWIIYLSTFKTNPLDIEYSLAQIDKATFRIIQTTVLPSLGSDALKGNYKYLWILYSASGEYGGNNEPGIIKFDKSNFTIITDQKFASVTPGNIFSAIDETSIWLSYYKSGSSRDIIKVSRSNPTNYEVINTAFANTGLSADNDFLWVINTSSDVIQRYNKSTELFDNAIVLPVNTYVNRGDMTGYEYDLYFEDNAFLNQNISGNKAKKDNIASNAIDLDSTTYFQPKSKKKAKLTVELPENKSINKIYICAHSLSKKKIKLKWKAKYYMNGTWETISSGKKKFKGGSIFEVGESLNINSNKFKFVFKNLKIKDKQRKFCISDIIAVEK